MRIYLLCPVRLATPKQESELMELVIRLESEGHEVFYPAIDNIYEDIDKTGEDICLANESAIICSDIVYIYWCHKSTGSYFDLGLAWAYKKPIKLVNEIEVPDKPTFESLLANWPWQDSEGIIDG